MLQPRLTIRFADPKPFNGRACLRWLISFRLTRATECVWHKTAWRLVVMVRWLREEGVWFVCLSAGNRDVNLRRAGGKWTRVRYDPPPDTVEKDGVRITVTTDYVAPCRC